jgi:hypothetical protein
VDETVTVTGGSAALREWGAGLTAKARKAQARNGSFPRAVGESVKRIREMWGEDGCYGRT